MSDIMRSLFKSHEQKLFSMTMYYFNHFVVFHSKLLLVLYELILQSMIYGIRNTFELDLPIRNTFVTDSS